MTENNWYVITGGPSTGKTTLLEELAKLGYQTAPEAAREEIDHALQKGVSVADLRRDELKFQEAVARRRVAIESRLDPTQLTFIDRGMPDSLAYMRFYNYPVADWLQQLLKESSYKKAFLMAPLPKFQDDYARTETSAFSEQIPDLLAIAYKESGIEIVNIPPVSPKERAKFLLANLD